MPNNKNRNKNQKGSFNHNNKNGINKKYHHHKGGKYNDQRKYIAPHLITDDFDEDLEGRGNNRQNSRNNNSHHQNKKKIYDGLEKMGMTKEPAKKLAIGDDDTVVKKQLLSSKLHCKPDNVPQDVFNIIVKFLQDYFTCYDQNRDNLLAAYNPKVLFSLSVNTSNSGAYRVFKFDDYIKESRNLKRLYATDEYALGKRFKLLHQGHIDTVNFLRKLPPTEHDPSTFKLDNCFFTQNMVTFSVVGAVKEGKSTDKVRPLRSFTRTFVCIPDANTSMSIINEEYVIANISTHQFRNYYKPTNKQQDPVAEASSSSNITANSSTITPIIESGLTEAQNQMIKEFSAKSNLNLMWSHDCLQQVNWNFDAAAELFVQYKSQIPLDAFLK